MSTAARHTFRWLKPDVYPLIGAVSVGVTAGVVIIARKLSAVSHARMVFPILGAEGCVTDISGSTWLLEFAP